jgi:hypothetical protein
MFHFINKYKSKNIEEEYGNGEETLLIYFVQSCAVL